MLRNEFYARLSDRRVTPPQSASLGLEALEDTTMKTNADRESLISSRSSAIRYARRLARETWRAAIQDAYAGILDPDALEEVGGWDDNTDVSIFECSKIPERWRMVVSAESIRCLDNRCRSFTWGDDKPMSRSEMFAAQG
jgi:hypothetical protein